MFGVVLWSNPRSGEAVLWCEDRAEIAYFNRSVAVVNGDADPETLTCDAGDLVQFDILCTHATRVEAINLEVVTLERPIVPPSVPRHGESKPLETTGSATVIELDARRGPHLGFDGITLGG